MKKIRKERSPEEILDAKIEKIQRNREWKRSIWELLLFGALLYVVLMYVVGFAIVKGNSMAPTLHENELLMFYRLDTTYHPGDVVVFRKEEQVEYVKRIIALEGDEVDFCEESGCLLVNGKQKEEPYIYTSTRNEADKIEFPYTLKDGEIFVLGDNRTASMDSRNFGCIKQSDIVGRVILHLGRVQ